MILGLHTVLDSCNNNSSTIPPGTALVNTLEMLVEPFGIKMPKFDQELEDINNDIKRHTAFIGWLLFGYQNK